MEIELSPKRRFCSFDQQTVYQFHIYTDWGKGNPCDVCAFRGSLEPLQQTEECLLVPCDALHRADKTDGFWLKSTLVDYLHFKKILAAGG